ncbi:ATP-binding protein [Leptospira levettii]|uniref:AAA family ATPase n=1 Tax=Leptospira levettii TaxID=2023178 RepID=UPI00223D035A|nr:AAA family ATPase [Leptospira levettii]MCW7506194.1 ATP-binding protein [Leptospira levettii]MCW7517284.1 ATP-binding protein [Leptospira levettii]
MKYYHIAYKSNLPPGAKYPCFSLVKDGWNDYGYYTLYNLAYHPTSTTKIELGYLKILQKEEVATKIPIEFSQLSEEYCSLGSDLNFYRKLYEIFEENIYKVLGSLNDCAIDEKIRDKFNHLEGFKKSLLRSSEDEKTLAEALNVLKGVSKIYNFNFSFKCRLSGSIEDHDVKFDFTKSDDKIPNRLFCIIGKNGTGKTQFLANLAIGLSGQNQRLRKNFLPGRPLFSKILAISYSLFDNFEKPKSTKNFNYTYCGFRDSDNQILSESEIQNKLTQSVKQILETEFEEIWLQSLSEIFSEELLNEILESLKLDKKIDIFKTLMISSGQGIILNFVSHILANIREESLIIFDEPETHLHPNAISKVIKIIYGILELTNSYAVIATHSPIIVQQIPSKYVIVFDRIENLPDIKQINIESFGENLTIITDEVFGNVNEKEFYKIVFDKLKKTISLRSLPYFFEKDLSFNAKIYFSGNNDEKS